MLLVARSLEESTFMEESTFILALGDQSISEASVDDCGCLLLGSTVCHDCRPLEPHHLGGLLHGEGFDVCHPLGPAG